MMRVYAKRISQTLVNIPRRLVLSRFDSLGGAMATKVALVS